MANLVQEEKLFWIDNLRALATIGVIFLHVSAPLIYKFGVIPMSWWWVGNIFNSLVRGSVPIFLMVTGALLLPKEYDLSTFLKKRFLRVLTPFFFWALVHIVMNLLLKIHSGEVHNLNDGLDNIASKISSGIAYHYWYVYLIIGIYLFLPIIGKWVRNSSKKEILYFLILWMTITLLSQTPVSGFKYYSQITYYFSGSLGFVVLGYYLTKYPFLSKNKKVFWSLILLLLVAFLFTIIGTYYLSNTSGKSVQTLYSYFSLNVIIATICIFLLFSLFSVKNRFLNNSLAIVSKYSYGIYLSHVLVLTILSFLKIDCMLFHPAVGILLTVILCLGMSGSIVFIINKLPYGKYISG